MRKVLPSFRLPERLASAFGRSVKVSVMGKTLHMDLRDQAVSSEIFAKGIWEPEETKFLEEILQPGMVFVDIGANIGYYTVLASSLVGATGKVFAFEPDPKNFAFLKKNITENHCHNVLVNQKAVGAATGQLLLYRSGKNFGDHRTYEPQDHRIREQGTTRMTVAVNAISLDDYFADRSESIDFIKMDIQGSEYNALVGMRAVLHRNPAVVILTEFWPTGLLQAGVPPNVFLDEVRSQEFVIHRLGRGRLEEISDANILSRLAGDEYMSLVLSKKIRRVSQV